MDDKTLSEYFELLSFQSISSEPSYEAECRKCVEWLKKKIEALGMSVTVFETSHHPVLLAETTAALPGNTALLYNHYDVQPVDPLEEWHSPPFTPAMKGDQIFARGAQDNKGQLFYVLLALRNLLKKGPSPLPIKWIIEGDEECGSPGLHALLPKIQDQIRAQSLIIVDGGISSLDKPGLSLGMRGLITFDLELDGSFCDLHSGSHGGLAFNPIHALVELLASVRDPSGTITIPGFYDDLEPLTDEEKRNLSLDFDQKEYFRQFGIPASGGEQDFSPLERNWLRPTFEINGISGGYAGAGFKTVIPAKAFAKISCRLGRGQSPDRIGHLIENYFISRSEKGIQVKAKVHIGGGPAVLTSPNSRAVHAFSEAINEIFNSPAKNILEGASIPIVSALSVASGAEPLLLGLGLPGDQIHAPNEHFDTKRLELGSLLIEKGLQFLATSKTVNH